MRFERIVISFALASTALATACEIEKHQPSSSNNEDTNSATPTSPSVSDAQPSALPEFSDASSVDAPADAVAERDAAGAALDQRVLGREAIVVAATEDLLSEARRDE